MSETSKSGKNPGFELATFRIQGQRSSIWANATVVFPRHRRCSNFYPHPFEQFRFSMFIKPNWRSHRWPTCIVNNLSISRSSQLIVSKFQLYAPKAIWIKISWKLVLSVKDYYYWSKETKFWKNEITEKIQQRTGFELASSGILALGFSDWANE